MSLYQTIYATLVKKNAAPEETILLLQSRAAGRRLLAALAAHCGPLLGVRAVQLTVMLPLQALVLLWLTRSPLIRRVLDAENAAAAREKSRGGRSFAIDGKTTKTV